MGLQKRILLLMIPTLVGCQTYLEKPLVPLAIMEEVEQSRQNTGLAESGPGFLALARRLFTHSPILQRAREKYQQARAGAAIPTPWPNPSLGFGPMLGTKLDPGGSSKKLQPMVEFGFTIPLNGRLGKADDCQQAQAREALVDLVCLHRECYLELRGLWTDLALSIMAERAQEDIMDSTRHSLRLCRRLIDAGAATALDLGVLELEVYQGDVALTEARHQSLTIRQKIARLIGLALPPTFLPPADSLPALEGKLPALELIKNTMLANHPDLGRLRAGYEVAEKGLRLEIAKQYPDLEFGSSYGGDPGADKKVWGLTLGITLPVFDRNQQAIASAAGEREVIRAGYAATLREALADLEGLHAGIALVSQKLQLLREKVLPRAKSNYALSQKAISAAGIDAFRHLEVERTLRTLTLERLHTEGEIRGIYTEMERLIGRPLLIYPGETPADFPGLTSGDVTEVEMENAKMEQLP